ncbi:MAG: hypothetical protein RL398_2363 [Planctomycetota bacterium]
MAIRKEQVLAVACLVVAGLVYSSRSGGPPMVTSITMQQLEYKPGEVRSMPLASGEAIPMRRKSFATEPSETQPLPPRALAFPPRKPRTVVAPPLPIGPDFGHALVLAGEGGVVEGVTLSEPQADAGGEAAGEGQEPAPSTRAEREAIAARSYDRVFQQGLTAPFFGTVEVDGMDRFDLETMQNFDGVTIRLRNYNVDTGKVGRVMVFGNDDRMKVAKVVLADSLRNEITRRTRRIPVDGGHLDERGAVIRWLLEQAREDSSVYKDALAQADLYVQSSGGDLEGLRWQQRVLQAKGDLAAEYALLDGIQGPHRETAFRYTGLGQLKARLGLWNDAEADLRKGAELAPNDARPHAALAEFLLQRGRSAEAVAAAARAEQTFGSLLDAGDRQRAGRAILACRLAVDDVAAAQDALRYFAGTEKAYLDGAVKYAAGDIDGALGAFRLAGGADGGAAKLGQGACLLRAGQWQEAYETLLAVFDQEPMLRHRAASSIAYLMLRLGQYESALAWLDRSQEADPTDPYAHYLRGAVLVRTGDLGGAEQALLACLKLRDDFVHALVEMTAVLSTRALDQGSAEAAAGALRYGTRAVQLAHKPTVELWGLQGLLANFAGDLRTAQTAFTQARDLAADERGKLAARGALAVIAYSRGLREEAENTLTRMAADLPKEDGLRQWAEASLAAIDDHGQKEMLGDGFERSEVGGIWPGERDGSLGAQVRDGNLVFRGNFSRNGQGEVFVRRAGAVAKGKNFLAVGCRMMLGPNQPRSEGFSGLRIATQRGSGREYDLRVQIGIREGQPYLMLEESREEPLRTALEVPGFDVTQWQDLELRVVPRGDQGRNFALEVSWNGRLIRSHELKTLTGNTNNELETVLFASGSKGGEVDVRFDEYRLERRKER